jgi:hypothetical protein
MIPSLLLFLAILAGISQGPLPGPFRDDPVPGIWRQDSAGRGQGRAKGVLRREAEYSLAINGLIFFDGLKGRRLTQAGFQQNLICRFGSGKDGRIQFTGRFVHGLGIQHFFDSLTLVSNDENTLTARLDMVPGKRVTGTLTSILSTPLLNRFDYYVNDSGRTIAMLSSAFLTPLTWTISGGFSLNLAWTSLTVGLSGARLTYLRDPRVFSSRNTQVYCGVPAGKGYLMEYGLSFQFLLNRDFLRRFHVDCDLLLFRNYDARMDLRFRNFISLKISKFLKASLQTRMVYDEKSSRNLQVENLLCIGFCCSL